MKTKVVFVLVLIASVFAGFFLASFTWDAMNEMLGHTSLHEQVVVMLGCVTIALATPMAVFTAIGARKKSSKSV